MGMTKKIRSGARKAGKYLRPTKSDATHVDKTHGTAAGSIVDRIDGEASRQDSPRKLGKLFGQFRAKRKAKCQAEADKKLIGQHADVSERLESSEPTKANGAGGLTEAQQKSQQEVPEEVSEETLETALEVERERAEAVNVLMGQVIQIENRVLTEARAQQNKLYVGGEREKHLDALLNRERALKDGLRKVLANVLGLDPEESKKNNRKLNRRMDKLLADERAQMAQVDNSTSKKSSFLAKVKSKTADLLQKFFNNVKNNVKSFFGLDTAAPQNTAASQAARQNTLQDGAASQAALQNVIAAQHGDAVRDVVRDVVDGVPDNEVVVDGFTVVPNSHDGPDKTPVIMLTDVTGLEVQIASKETPNSASMTDGADHIDGNHDQVGDDGDQVDSDQVVSDNDPFTDDISHIDISHIETNSSYQNEEEPVHEAGSAAEDVKHLQDAKKKLSKENKATQSEMKKEYQKQVDVINNDAKDINQQIQDTLQKDIKRVGTDGHIESKKALRETAKRETKVNDGASKGQLVDLQQQYNDKLTATCEQHAEDKAGLKQQIVVAKKKEAEKPQAIAVEPTKVAPKKDAEKPRAERKAERKAAAKVVRNKQIDLAKEELELQRAERDKFKDNNKKVRNEALKLAHEKFDARTNGMLISKPVSSEGEEGEIVVNTSERDKTRGRHMLQGDLNKEMDAIKDAYQQRRADHKRSDASKKSKREFVKAEAVYAEKVKEAEKMYKNAQKEQKDKK